MTSTTADVHARVQASLLAARAIAAKWVAVENAPDERTKTTADKEKDPAANEEEWTPADRPQRLGLGAKFLSHKDVAGRPATGPGDRKAQSTTTLTTATGKSLQRQLQKHQSQQKRAIIAATTTSNAATNASDSDDDSDVDNGDRRPAPVKRKIASANDVLASYLDKSGSGKRKKGKK